MWRDPVSVYLPEKPKLEYLYAQIISVSWEFYALNQEDMWLHLILVLLTQCCTVMLNQTDYLTTKTERGYEGEVVRLTCGPGGIVTILSVLVGSQAGSGGRCEGQTDQGPFQGNCRGNRKCFIHISSSLLQSVSLPCSGGGDR